MNRKPVRDPPSPLANRARKAEDPDSLRRNQDKAPSTSSSDGDEDSTNSRRLQKLNLSEKAAKPGQKRLPEESADGERRFKHSKSPENLDANQEASFFQRELSKKAGMFPPNQVASRNNPEQPSQTGQQPSGGVFRVSEISPNDDRGRSGPRHNDKRTNSQDRSTSPPEAGGGGGPDEDPPEGDTSILLQPDTRPITAEQLVNEVKGIYSGLVMVEKKCVEIIAQRVLTGGKLSNDQWQALIALHRTLLHEHHDFFVSGLAARVSIGSANIIAVGLPAPDSLACAPPTRYEVCHASSNVEKWDTRLPRAPETTIARLLRSHARLCVHRL